MKKQVFVCGLLLSMIVVMAPMVKGAERTYIVEAIQADGTTKKIDESNSFTAAMATYDSHVANANNLVIREGDTIWRMKYGVVLFNQNKTCDYNVTYTTEHGEGYTNGCYGIDGAYLESRNEAELMDFVISGVYGSTTSEDVRLQPIETAAKVSTYRVEDGKLYHQIKTQMEDDLYSTSVYLGDAPEQLQDDQEYYSYDGHYFYLVSDDFSGFHQMVDDLRSQQFTHAVNKEPYYNYYQYVSHRSTTNYTEKELNSYLEDQLHIKNSLRGYRSIGTSYHGILTQSLLKDSAGAFLQYQDQFGANALMMMALSMNESATGRSYLAYTRNNLFGHAAFDSAVEENASRYQSVSASIYSHAKHYLQDSYLNPDSFTWHGGFFGNKASGMNVSYASDPYWGEKAAQYYIRMDEALGKKDQNNQTLGIIMKDREVKVYKDKHEQGEVLYSNGGLRDFSFLVLAKDQDWVKVQIDPSGNEEGYDFTACIGYVKSSDLDLIIEGINTNEAPRAAVRFDAQDGTFENGSSTIQVSLREGQLPSIIPPVKKQWLFVGWDKELMPAKDDVTYTARYEKIKETSITTLPKTTYEKEELLDVSGGMMTITLAQGDQKEIPLDSSMVSGYDPEQLGTQALTVTMQGAECTYDVEVSEAHQAAQASLLSQIQELIQTTSIHDDMSEVAKASILSLKETIDEHGTPDLSRDQYRLLDTFLQMAYGNSLQVIVSDDDTAMSVSGLSIATPLNSPSFFPQIIKFSLSKGLDEDTESLLTQVAEGNDYTMEYCFQLSGEQSFSTLALQDDVMIAMKQPDDTQLNKQYMILGEQDGEVFQVPTSQSNTLISYTIEELGNYALVSRPTSNIYAGGDIIENNSVKTNGTDVFTVLIWAGILLLVAILAILTFIIRKKRKSGGTPKKQKRQKKAANVKQQEQKEASSFLRSHQIMADEPMKHEDSNEEPFS